MVSLPSFEHYTASFYGRYRKLLPINFVKYHCYFTLLVHHVQETTLLHFIQSFNYTLVVCIDNNNSLVVFRLVDTILTTGVLVVYRVYSMHALSVHKITKIAITH